MVKVNAEEFTEKWNRRLKGARTDMERGVKKVSENPMEKAKEKKDKFVNRLNEAIAEGKWEAGLDRITLEEWRKAYLEKGLSRVAQGADHAVDKVKRFAGELLAYEESLQEKIKAMPDVTFEDAINRMVEWVRGMKEFKRSR